MANLVICDKCRNMWSISFDPMDAIMLLRLAWCPECRVRNTLVPIGNVPGVNKPPIHFGTSAPPALPPAKAPLLLTYEPHNTGGGGTATAVQPAVQPAVQREAPTNVLPAGTGVVVGQMSEQAATTAFRNHVQGQPIPYPPAAVLQRYFSSSADKLQLDAADYYGAIPSKVYARMIAIHAIEMGFNLKIEIIAPKGETYSGAKYLRRDLSGTLLRIAKGESISKSLNNAAYNNDGTLSSDKIKYDRYGKGYKGTKTGSAHLPQPSLVTGLPGKYWEYYVDRDAQKGANPLSIGGGRPGAERLFLQVPDYIFYTWNHYGSDVKAPKEKSALGDSDIWAVYSYIDKKWQLGLTRT
jgi:hypothetical protein